MKNIWFYGPGAGWGGGHGGDEYGNCTVYLSTPLGCIVYRYPTGHKQEDVEYHGLENANEWITRYVSRDMWLEDYGDKSSDKSS